jgi:ATP-binding protein involved in chromosome partitioning
LLPNKIPIIGVVENMSWFTPAELPNSKYYIFGNGGGSKLAEINGTYLLGQIPLVQGVREGGDKGMPAVLDDENLAMPYFMEMAKNVARGLVVLQSQQQSN